MPPSPPDSAPMGDPPRQEGLPAAGDGSDEVSPESEPPRFMLWIIVGAAAALLCWPGWFLALPGAFLAYVAKGRWESGARLDARKKLRIARTLIVVGIALGVLGYLLVLTFRIFVCGRMDSPPMY